MTSLDFEIELGVLNLASNAYYKEETLSDSVEVKAAMKFFGSVVLTKVEVEVIQQTRLHEASRAGLGSMMTFKFGLATKKRATVGALNSDDKGMAFGGLHRFVLGHQEARVVRMDLDLRDFDCELSQTSVKNTQPVFLMVKNGVTAFKADGTAEAATTAIAIAQARIIAHVRCSEPIKHIIA